MQSQQPKLNVSLDKTTAITCECGSQVFQEGVLIRKASKFLTGTTEDAIIPIPTFCCSQCGKVPDEFMPTQLKTAKQ
jgi:hypothetical protein